MKREQRYGTRLAGLALLATAMACEGVVDPALNDRVMVIRPNASVTQAALPASLPSGMAEGDVRLCKTVPADDPGGTFTFDVTVTPLLPASGASVNSTVPLAVGAGATACTTIYHSIIGGGGADQVVVTERTPPTDWDLTGIAIVQHLYTALQYPPVSTTDAEDVATRTATLYVNNDMVRVVTFTNDYTAPPPPPTGSQGCTPGYWKQKQHFDSWTGYMTTDGFNATFGIGTNWFSNSFTLLNGLKDGGGGTSALARHAVAALLNAASGFYPMSEAEVKAAVQAAYNGTTGVESTKNTFAGNNELGCPLN